jgi:hypothetical protein
VRLGATYVDKITGFVGVATGHVEYLTGCNQTLLTPQCKEGERNKRPDSEWFDDQRLEEVGHQQPVKLDNGDTPGCDRQAPKR